MVAIVLSFIFLQVYMSASPFISDHLGKSKIIAQTQILVIFVLALAIKQDTLAVLGYVVISLLFVIAIFANVVFDLSIFIRRVLDSHYKNDK